MRLRGMIRMRSRIRTVPSDWLVPITSPAVRGASSICAQAASSFSTLRTGASGGFTLAPANVSCRCGASDFAEAALMPVLTGTAAG